MDKINCNCLSHFLIGFLLLAAKSLLSGLSGERILDKGSRWGTADLHRTALHIWETAKSWAHIKCKYQLHLSLKQQNPP